MYVCICIITLTCYLAMPPYGWERFAHVLMRLILRLLAVDVQALSVLVSIVRGTSALCEKKQFTVPHLLMINQRGSYGSMVCHIYQCYPQAANCFDSP